MLQNVFNKSAVLVSKAEGEGLEFTGERTMLQYHLDREEILLTEMLWVSSVFHHNYRQMSFIHSGEHPRCEWGI